KSEPDIDVGGREYIYAITTIPVHFSFDIFEQLWPPRRICWLQNPTHFACTVLHEYIIMANHLRGTAGIVGANHYWPKENRASNLRAKDGSINRTKDVSPLRVGTERSLLRSYKTRIQNNFQSMFRQAPLDLFLVNS